MPDAYLFLAVTVCGFALALSCLGLWIQLGERRRAREASRPDPLPLDPFDPNVPPEPIGVVQYTYAPKPEENVLHPPGGGA